MWILSRERILYFLSKTPWLLLCLSLGGWMLFIIGFGLTNHNPQLLEWLGEQFKGRTQDLFFSFWVCCFVGAAVYIAGILHLLFRRWFISVTLHILTGVYLISCGAAIMTEIILNNLTLSFLQQTQPLWSYVQLEMAGCVISFLSLVLFMSLWPLLSVHPLPSAFRSHSVNQQQLSRSHDDEDPLFESGQQPRGGGGGGGGRRGDVTAHKFAVTNTSHVGVEEGVAAVATETGQERRALLPIKTN